MTVCIFVLVTPRPGETILSHWVIEDQYQALSLGVPQSAVGLALDIYILALPILAVNKLQLPTRRKIGVIMLFMTGLMEAFYWSLECSSNCLDQGLHLFLAQYLLP